MKSLIQSLILKNKDKLSWIIKLAGTAELFFQFWWSGWWKKNGSKLRDVCMEGVWSLEKCYENKCEKKRVQAQIFNTKKDTVMLRADEMVMH